jgi:hypothetical protein
MKRINTVIGLSSLMSILLFASPYTAAAVVSEVLDTEITVGDVFEVNVTLTDLSADDALVAFGFDVNRPAGLSYTGANVATQFSDDSQLLLDTDVAGSAFPAVPGGEDILLATLSFQAMSAGSHLLSLTSNPGNANEGLFTLLDPQTDLTSSVHINVVPIPGTLLLFCSGLFGLIQLRKAQKVQYPELK